MEKIVEKSDDPDDVTTFDWGVGVGGEGGGGRTTNFRNEESRLKIMFKWSCNASMNIVQVRM